MLIRAALEQKKAEEKKDSGPIDYDAPVESEKNTIGVGTKVIRVCGYIRQSFTFKGKRKEKK